MPHFQSPEERDDLICDVTAKQCGLHQTLEQEEESVPLLRVATHTYGEDKVAEQDGYRFAHNKRAGLEEKRVGGTK